MQTSDLYLDPMKSFSYEYFASLASNDMEAALAYQKKFTEEPKMETKEIVKEEIKEVEIDKKAMYRDLLKLKNIKFFAGATEEKLRSRCVEH